MSEKINSADYLKKIDKKVPPSKLLINSSKAFVIGGIICTLGQVIFSVYTACGLDKDKASSLVSVTLIFIGILLTGTDIYHKIAVHGGAGTLVPITGFANAMSSPAIEAKTEGYVLGVGVKLFSVAGPVIVYGICSSAIAGVIMFLFKMY